MALTVGTDSYVTVAEADQYITEYYMTLAPERSVWEQLDTADKEVLLRSSAEAIDAIRYTGKKSGGSEQILAFPRIVTSCGCNLMLSDINKIKAAQIREAATRALIATESAMDEDNMGSIDSPGTGGAVSSYTIGNLSETKLSGVAAAEADSRGVTANLYNEYAKNVLSKWTGGGFRIC